MIEIIVTIALVGLVIWAVTSLIPMPPKVTQAIYVLGVVFLVLYLLNAFGLYSFGSHGRVRL